MWKKLSAFGMAAMLATPMLAADSPTVNSTQLPKPNALGTPPDANRYADPFFAPPDGRPVMDALRPGSGAALSESLVPYPELFRPEHVWFAPDFYHAVGQGTLLPPLVTSAPNGTGPGAGALNRPATSIIFGGERALNHFRPGVRVNAGLWLTDDYRFGIDGTFLYLGDATSSFGGSASPTGPVLARPVYLGDFGAQVGVPVESISARAHSAVIGGDVNFRYGLTTSELGRLDLLVGYRYLNLRDTVDVESSHAFANTPLLDIAVSDHFRTLNQFHGCQVGLGGTHRLFGRLTLTTKATVAIGVNISDVTIGGKTFTATGVSDGGLLTGPANIGNHRDNYFSVMPEATAKLGWDFTDRLRVNVGYSGLFWTNVRRAADQIDTAIQLQGRPGFPNDSTTYWLQGWTVGLDLRY